jgi:hypothetical protein
MSKIRKSKSASKGTGCGEPDEAAEAVVFATPLALAESGLSRAVSGSWRAKL